MNEVKFDGILKGVRLFEGETYKRVSFALEQKREGNKEKKDRIECIGWGAIAETIQDSCREGDTLLITGTINRDAWKDKYGNWKESTYITAKTIESLTNKIESMVIDEDETKAIVSGPSYDDLPY